MFIFYQIIKLLIFLILLKLKTYFNIFNSKNSISAILNLSKFVMNNLNNK